MKKYYSLIFCALCAMSAAAQVHPEHPDGEPRNKDKAILLHLMFGLHTSAGDLADRFGPDGSFGLGLEYLTKNNFILGAEGHYFFGSAVNEDPLAILRTPEGSIIGKDRLLASVVLRKRGYYFGGTVGRLFAFNDKRSGIRLTLGAGLLRHWIRIQDDNNSVTELTGEYKKGYDRLTGGLALNQFVGWQSLAGDRRSNWLIGLEFNEGFTNTLRDWDFSEMRKLDEKRLDIRIGLRVAWTLPFYQGKPEEIFY
jgi:hypothetical protein